MSEVACLRTFAFSSLISVRRAAGEWSNGPGSVRSEGVMADFLYIFSSFRSFYKTSSHQKSPPDTAHPCTGVHSCLILSFFFLLKPQLPILAFLLHWEITGNLLMNIQCTEILIRVHFKYRMRGSWLFSTTALDQHAPISALRCSRRREDIKKSDCGRSRCECT